MSSKQAIDPDKSKAEGEDVTAHMFVAEEPGGEDPERKRKHSESPDEDDMGKKRKRK